MMPTPLVVPPCVFVATLRPRKERRMVFSASCHFALRVWPRNATTTFMMPHTDSSLTPVYPKASAARRNGYHIARADRFSSNATVGYGGNACTIEESLIATRDSDRPTAASGGRVSGTTSTGNVRNFAHRWLNWRWRRSNGVEQRSLARRTLACGPACAKSLALTIKPPPPMSRRGPLAPPNNLPTPPCRSPNSTAVSAAWTCARA